MDTSRKMISIFVGAYVFGCLFGHASALPSTNRVSRNIVTPEFAFPAHVNELLSEISCKQLQPHMPENRRDMDFRVITVHGHIQVDETVIPHKRKLSHDVVIFDFTVENLNHASNTWHVTHYWLPSDGGQPEVRVTKKGSFEKKEVKRWFDVLWRGEIFSLPPSRKMLRDDYSGYGRFLGSSRDFLIEKSTVLDYVLISRDWDEGILAVDAVLDLMREWFPDVNFPKTP